MNLPSSDAPTPLPEHQTVDWWAIAAGLFCSLASFSILIALGTMIIPALACCGGSVTVETLLFIIFVEATSIFLGAYTAARFSSVSSSTLPSEAAVRDGWHGLVVWGSYYLIAALFANWITVGGIFSIIENQTRSESTKYDAIVSDSSKPENPVPIMKKSEMTTRDSDPRSPLELSNNFSIPVKFVTILIFICNGFLAWHVGIWGGLRSSKN